jgi:nucleoside-diphosphate-sugar epimerase
LKVLVTGARGFLGQHVVAALLQRGHSIRVLIRPTTSIDDLACADQVTAAGGDLRGSGSLAPAFNDVEALVHLTARAVGSRSSQMADTVVGAERLLETMAGSMTRRLVLASSFSVYGWSEIQDTLTEDAPPGWKPPWDFAQCLHRAFETLNPLGDDTLKVHGRHQLQNV